jgi:hypothetical protein
MIVWHRHVKVGHCQASHLAAFCCESPPYGGLFFACYLLGVWSVKN